MIAQAQIDQYFDETLMRLVQLYDHQHLVTVKLLITEWTPESDVKNLKFNIRYVAASAGVRPSTYLTAPYICFSPWAEILVALFQLENGFDEDEKVLLASAKEAWYRRFE